MKKIFAIALALVMVLSMASAFAFVGTCGDYAYTCPTVGCGVAKAEVVQFAAVNTLDGFEETTCAGVVKGQKVFFGVKVIFDANVNSQWFQHYQTGLKTEFANVSNNTCAHSFNTFSALLANKTAGDVSGKTFWLSKDAAGTYSLASSFNPTTCVFEAVADNTHAEVCANVVYKFDGTSDDLLKAGGASIDSGWLKYGSFEVYVNDNFDSDNADINYVIDVKKGSDSIRVYVVNGIAKYVEFNGDLYYADGSTVLVAKNGGYDATNNVFEGNFAAAAGLACSDVDELMALININFNDCVNADVIKGIFGWANGDAVCKTWNADAKAIVNAECEVQVMSIPKTGDASVLAWLF